MSRIARALKKSGSPVPENLAREAAAADGGEAPLPWDVGPTDRVTREQVAATPPAADIRPHLHQPRRLPPPRPGHERAGAAGGPSRLPVLAPHDVPIGIAMRSAPPSPSDPPIARYWQVFRRRWPTGLVLLLVVVGGVAVGTLLRTPVYRADALLEIRRDSAAAVPVEALFSSEKIPSDELETQYGVLKSRTLAERVVAAVARYTAPTAAGTAATAGSSAAAATSGTAGTSGRTLAASTGLVAPAAAADAAAVDAAAVERFSSALVVNPQRGSRLVEVQFSSPDPKLAAFTVNAVLDNFLALRMDEAERSAQWLQEQIQDAQHRLERSERQIQGYLRTHGVEAMETGKGETVQMANERLRTLREALAQAQAERMDKQSANDQAQRLAAAGGLDSPVAQQLTVRLTDLRREHAKMSSAFKDDYPAVKALNDQIRELEQALAHESQAVVARGQREYQAAVGKEALLRKALEEQNAIVRGLSEGSSGSPGYEALKRELITNQEQFAVLGEKLKQVRIANTLKAANVGIVDRATPPTDPDGMPFPLTMLLATMVGLVVASGGVFLRERFDTSMRTVTEVENQLGVRTLAAIPAFAHRARLLPERATSERQWQRIDDQGVQRSPLGDAFAALRNAVLVQQGDAESRVLLVTSAQSAEGKTTVSINLALSLARLNYRVLLVDGNLRYPCVQRALGLADRPGLVEYLASGVAWRNCLHVQVRPNFDVLAGTEPQGSPADLLSLPAMGELLDAASREYDFVIVDSPAVLPHLADVRSLCAVVDSVLFTIRHGSTPREAVALAMSQVDRVAGVVLNRSVGPDIALNHQADSTQRTPAVDS